jgi:hypothetical protein
MEFLGGRSAGIKEVEQMEENPVEKMLRELMTVTGLEREAKRQREVLELAIAEAYKEQMPVEGGAKTFEVEGIKFEVKTGYRFSADVEAIKALPCAALVLKTKTEFSDSQYKKLWEMNKEAAQAISDFVTATPSKPAVKVKEVANG